MCGCGISETPARGFLRLAESPATFRLPGALTGRHQCGQAGSCAWSRVVAFIRILVALGGGCPDGGAAWAARRRTSFSSLFGGIFRHRETPRQRTCLRPDPFGLRPRGSAAVVARGRTARAPRSACAPATAFISSSTPIRVQAPPQMCHAFCPAGETRLYSGSNIDYRYRERRQPLRRPRHRLRLPPATGRRLHLQRSRRLRPGAYRPAKDPTLEPGDVVATRDGLMAVYRRRGHQRGQGRQFHPDRQITADVPGTLPRPALPRLKVAPPGPAGPGCRVTAFRCQQTRDSRNAEK